jgi:putative ABC transport system permease protein
LYSFRVLLQGLPTALRARHGEEIEALLLELLREAYSRSGTRGVFRVWLRSSFDLVLSRDLERVPGERRRKRLGLPHFLDTVRQDVRLASRNLMSKPTVSLISVGSLVVGIAITVGIFSFADTTLWQEWSFDEPDRVVQIFEYQDQHLLPSWPTFRHIDETIDVLDGVLASQLDLFALGHGQGSETFTGERVSGDYFRVLGIPPIRGRYPAKYDTFQEGPLPVVISQHTWTTTFGGTPEIVGLDIRLNGYPATVVAVAPHELDGAKWGVSSDLWVPMVAWARMDGWEEWEDDQGLTLTVMARMRNDVDLETVNAALGALATHLAEDRPEIYRGVEIRATDRLRGDMGPEMGNVPDAIALAAVLSGVLVLLVGCGNVASLLLARGVLRAKEVAVRYALGASRKRVIRQLLTESLLLATVATLLGLLLSTYGTEALLTLLPEFDFRVRFVTAPGPRSMALAAGLAVVTVVASGLAPALQLSRADLVEAMKAEGRAGFSGARSRLLGLVVVGMVGASVLALFLAGMFGETLIRGRALEPGFATEDRVMAVIPLRLAGHDWREATAMFEDLEPRLASLPGARSVGFSTGIPLGESWTSTNVYAADRTYSEGDPGVLTFRSSVSDDYFEAMGTRILRGRAFGREDGTAGPWVAIVNEELARLLWPGQDPIGRQIRFGLDEYAEPVEVVGVAETGIYYMVGETPKPAVFASFRQWPQAQAMVVVEGDGDPLGLIPGIRKELSITDPNVPLQRVRTAEAHLQEALWLYRLGASIGGVVSVLALLMAAVGLFGVISVALGARRREMGIRRALGAGSPEVLRLAVGGAVKLTVWGLLAGVAASYLASLAIRASLVGVASVAPGVLLGIAALVISVGAISGLIPGISASRVDPAAVLNTE